MLIIMYIFLEETVHESQITSTVSTMEILSSIGKALRSIELLASNLYLATLAVVYFVVVLCYSGIVDVVLFWAEYKFHYFSTSTFHQDLLSCGFLLSAAVSAVFMHKVVFSHFRELSAVPSRDFMTQGHRHSPAVSSAPGSSAAPSPLVWIVLQQDGAVKGRLKAFIKRP